jgi:integrase
MGVIVRQKVKGRGQPWWVFINHLGKRKSIRVGSREAAQALADKIQEKLKAGELRIAQEEIPTFGEYFEKWLAGHCRVHLKFSTQKGYGEVFEKHLKPLANRPLNQITRRDVKNLVTAKLASGLKPGTVQNIHGLISSLMSHAVEDELIPANPAARADVNPLSREEARDLLAILQEHHPRYYPFFLCALRTGMRLGELLALEWGDVDFRGGFIEVRRAYVRNRITTPKNHKGRRVDMSPQLAENLKVLQTERKQETLTKGWRTVPNLVFVNEDGGVIHEANLRNRVFFKGLARAGLRRVRIHDLRHTFASLLIQNGESLAYVKEQMGHHSIQITVDTYGHLVPGANREAVAKLDDDFLTYTSPDRVRWGCNEGGN